MPWREIKPLGIDLRLKDRQSPDGLCDDIRELRPVGYPENPIWKRIPGAESILQENPGVTIRSAFWHDRTRRGFLSDDPTSRLDRMIVVYSDKIRIRDTVANSWDATFNFSGLGAYQECHYEQLNEALFISVVGSDKTVQVVVIDDSIFEYQTPPLPNVVITPVAGTKGLSNGEYGVRFAWRYGDGVHGPLSTPQYLKLEAGAEPNDKSGLSVSAIPTSEVQSFFANGFDKIVAGLTVYITQKTPEEILDAQSNVIQEAQDAIEWIHNTQYYELGVLGFKLSEVTNQFIFSFIYEQINNDQIVSRVTANEDVIPHLQTGKILKAFNQRLLHGGTVVDFAKPSVPFHVITSEFGGPPASTDPGAGVFTLNSVTYTVVQVFNAYSPTGTSPEYRSVIVISHATDDIIGLFQSNGTSPLQDIGGWAVVIDGTTVTATWESTTAPIFSTLTVIPKTATNQQTMSINTTQNYP